MIGIVIALCVGTCLGQANHNLEMDLGDKKEALEIDALKNSHTNKQFHPRAANFQEMQSVNEAQFNATSQKLFNLEDINHDGAITESEILTMQSVNEAQFNATSQKLFDLEDMNHDGAITESEILSMFARYDTNGNGKMSRHEYTDSICALFPDFYPIAHYTYDQYDLNHDHTIDAPDYKMFFPNIDADGDGQITYEEYYAFGARSLAAYQTFGAHDLHAHTHSQCH